MMKVKDPKTGVETDVDSKETVNVDAAVSEAQKEQVAEVSSDPALAGRIKEKLKDKSPESAKADISAELASPGAESMRTPTPSSGNKTIQREDGTTTNERFPDHTHHYIHGSKVLITDEEKSKYDRMAVKLNEAQKDRGIDDIPLNDEYWNKKKELDAFVAGMKR